jgi:hypothetical protein
LSRYTFTLRSDADRERATRVIAAAPPGSRVDVKAPKRSVPQNDRMWAMLTDISMQLAWHGKQRKPNDWKKRFLDLLNVESELVPGLDGSGVVELGRSSSDLSKEEMSDMIELMFKFGAEHGVKFQDEQAA